MKPSSLSPSRRFDAWLAEAISADPVERDERLVHWQEAPAAREAHPREEHLLPLMVAAGAAPQEHGVRVFSDEVMGVAVSGVRFG
jgi:aromatic ring-opening dioxygenase catalytic subunit (LigB family)